MELCPSNVTRTYANRIIGSMGKTLLKTLFALLLVTLSFANEVYMTGKRYGMVLICSYTLEGFLSSGSTQIGNSISAKIGVDGLNEVKTQICKALR